jgi:hypothetical protein
MTNGCDNMPQAALGSLGDRGLNDPRSIIRFGVVIDHT